MSILNNKFNIASTGKKTLCMSQTDFFVPKTPMDQLPPGEPPDPGVQDVSMVDVPNPALTEGEKMETTLLQNVLQNKPFFEQ